MLLYLVFTLFLTIFFWSDLEHPAIQLLLRIIVILIYFLLASYYKKFGTIRQVRVFLPFLFLPFLYSETDFFNNILFEDLDIYLSHFEEKLFGSQYSVIFSQTFTNPFFAELMYFGYFSYYIMVIGLALFAYYRVDKKVGEWVGYMTIASFLIFYLIFDFIPVTGPQFFWANQLQALPDGYFFGYAIRLAQYIGERPTAAFPSSHVAICLILIWMSYKKVKSLFPILIAIGFVLVFSTIYLRAHYVVDVIAGLISAPLVYILANHIYNRLS